MNKKQKNSTVLQVEESDFRKAGTFGDKLICILREADQFIDEKQNVMLIPTNTFFEHTDVTINIFNKYLMAMRKSFIDVLMIRLDK